jgi:hypothetical protein
MSIVLRIALIIGALFALSIVVRKVRKVKDSHRRLGLLGLRCRASPYLAIFPGIAYFFSDLLGFLSPSNFVFLVVIALMLLKLFNLACEVSRLTDKVEQLSQEVALSKKEFGDNLQNKR